MTIKEKAERYDRAIKELRDFYRDYDTVSCMIDVKEELANILPELRESEDVKIKKWLISQLKIKSDGTNSELDIMIDKAISWLEKQGEKKHVEWHREDEQNLNACLGYIPDEFLRRWLMDVIHVKYDKSADKVEDEEYNGEDYGIDSLFHAQRILEKTLGKVDGYQTDDGILEHKCAITAVNKLYEQKPAELSQSEVTKTSDQVWSEEDERNWNNIWDVLDGRFELSDYGYKEAAKWFLENCPKPPNLKC